MRLNKYLPVASAKNTRKNRNIVVKKLAERKWQYGYFFSNKIHEEKKKK
jgi:hypothetical protein